MNSALGSLLATRLDAVLGTTLAQHPVLLDGARGHPVTQPATFLHGQDTTIRRGTGERGEAAVRAGGAGTSQVGQGATPGANITGQNQASARTILSEPARTILALLLSGMDGKTAVQGRHPLVSLSGSPSAAAPAAHGAPAPGGPGAASAALGQGVQPGTTAPHAAPPAGQMPFPPAAGGHGQSAGSPFPATAGQTTAARALLPQAPANLVPALASALQRVLGQSGMFYESHLAQMAFGQRSPTEVAREPQARLDPSAPQIVRATAEGGAPASGSAPASTAPSQTPGAAIQPAANPLPGMAPNAAPLVRQQLEVLANQAFTWQGEAWSGAPLQWEVQRRAPEDPGPETLATWATRLVLQLPRLGTVEARLTLAGERLVLRLGAPDSAPLLRQHLDVLREHLDRQGLRLTDTTVSHQPVPKASRA